MSSSAATVTEPAHSPLSASTDAIARLIAYGHAEAEPGYLAVATHQAQHRIALAEFWDISQGESVLEIGCGQGDCTAVLATAVGESGHVTAIDPADLDYGSPTTLGDAQAYLKSSAIGPRITFLQIDPVSHFRQLSESSVSVAGTYTYDAIVLAHSLFYFSSPALISETLALAAQHARRLCIAEYALTAARPGAVPHVLAALTQTNLECRKPPGTSTSNIRTVLSPYRIRELALAAAAAEGMMLLGERTAPPVEGLEDGAWEVWAVKDEAFVEQVEEIIKDEREKAVIFAMRDSVWDSAQAVKDRGEKLSTMDVWVASFGRE